VRGILIYCADHHYSHSVAISADQRDDDVRLSYLEPRFACTLCGKVRADERPDFNWNKMPVKAMGYRCSWESSMPRPARANPKRSARATSYCSQ
jgi:hypothetical protein